MYRHSWVNNCNELKYDEDHLLSCLPNCGPLERWTMIRLLFFLLLKYLSVTQPVCVTLNCIITMWAMSQICMFTYDDVCRDTLTYLELIESFSTFIFHLLIFIYNLHNRRRYSVQYVCQQINREKKLRKTTYQYTTCYYSISAKRSPMDVCQIIKFLL